ncbi:MAG: hypothetical protein LBT16_01720 [Treponema sp.]|jgi:hypothetical protein|nr:hypothetical protein [Treponema sp.]
MKKLLLFLIAFSAAFCLFAQEGTGIMGYLDDPEVESFQNEPRRKIDVGIFSFNTSIANNITNATEIFKKDIVIDAGKINNSLGEKDAQSNIMIDVSALQFNLNIDKRWGLGFGINLNGGLNLLIPKSLFALLAEGNADNDISKGTFSVYGGIFYEFGTSSHITLPALDGKLTLGFDPAFFVPVAYIPRKGISYTLDTSDHILLDAKGTFAIYTPVNADSTNPASIFSSGGVDFNFSAEYALVSRLDLGLKFTHIPLAPSFMRNGYNAGFATADGKPVMEIQNITDLSNGFSLNSPEVKPGDYGSLDPITVFRPLRFEAYSLFRPLSGTLSDLMVIKPIIGFTTDFAAEETFFNGILEIQLHAGHFFPGYLFNLYTSTGIEENFWRHKIGFEINLRAFELDFGIGLRSQDFLSSFKAAGVQVALGIRAGW